MSYSTKGSHIQQQLIHDLQINFSILEDQTVRCCQCRKLDFEIVLPEIK